MGKNNKSRSFLDDLALLDTSRQHYTGTVVLHQPSDAVHKMDDEGHNYVETDVVDGQQRLTTVVLLLNEMSKALGELGSGQSLAMGIRKKYVAASDEYGLSLYKLTLNKDTDDYFRSIILSHTPGIGGPPVVSAQRLLDARVQIAEYLNRASGNASRREEWLRDLHRKVTNQLHFNLYEVERAGEVGIIFEVMNDRGKQLTDLEKVKNYLLYCASTLDVSQQSRNELAGAINGVWGRRAQADDGCRTGGQRRTRTSCCVQTGSYDTIRGGRTGRAARASGAGLISETRSVTSTCSRNCTTT